MKAGFTLIEILVVATIIGLLATLGVVSYTVFSTNSRDARRRADVEQIRGALELFRSDNNTYVNTAAISCSAGVGNLSTYISKIPTDPKCATYTYNLTGVSASDYTLGAYLEGGGTGSCGSCGSVSCNYCVGPYGQK